MMRMQSPATAAIVTFALCAGASQAAAQPGDTEAAAAQRFAQGRALMERGDFEAACPAFEASLELDPALGTLLNLAYCYEELGRLASAWARYRELVILAARAGQRKRERFARERVAALEPRLPSLAINAPEAARAAGLIVTRDGVIVDSEHLEMPVYVDPGAHVVVASVPGLAPFSTTVTAIEAQAVVVEIPALAQVAEDAAEEPPALHVSDPLDPGRTRRFVGITTGSVGLLILASGLGTGKLAKDVWSEAFEQGLCDRDTLTCTPAGQEKTDSARSRATMSKVLIGAGVGMMAAGAVLYLTAPDAAEASGAAPRTTRLLPMAGPDSLGFAIAGGF